MSSKSAKRKPKPETQQTRVVFAPGRGQMWAQGPFRAEVVIYSSRAWKWRVWHVIGPVLISSGLSPGVRAAVARARAELVKANLMETPRG